MRLIPSHQNVLKFIEKVNEQFKTTIIIITHNEAIADMADTVIRIKDGQVASQTMAISVVQKNLNCKSRSTSMNFKM